MKVKRGIGFHGPRSRRAYRSLKKTAISVIVLLVLFVGGGLAYTWYMGQNNYVPSPSSDLKSKPKITVKHAQPAANAAVGVSLQMITSPVTPGSNASITIKSNPGATCSIKAVYNKIASTDSGLVPKVTDEYGMAVWSWTVGESVPIGKWPVTVTCVLGKKSGVYIADLMVVSSLD